MAIEISERVMRLAKQGGWVGVDLDGTMFTYDKWVGWNVFGEPIRPMIERIKAWGRAGVESRIVTARVSTPIAFASGGVPLYSDHRTSRCRVTGESFSDAMMVVAIQDHCFKHMSIMPRVQCFKDVNMIELWDDRAIQVIANTGRTLAEEYEAKEEAEHLDRLLFTSKP